MTAEPEPPGHDLPAPYRSPWSRLAEDLRDALADLRLRAQELLRLNREGRLPHPSWWPAALIPVFWPLILVAALALVAAALLWLSPLAGSTRPEPPAGGSAAVPGPADVPASASPVPGPAPGATGAASPAASEGAPPPPSAAQGSAAPPAAATPGRRRWFGRDSRGATAPPAPGAAPSARPAEPGAPAGTLQFPPSGPGSPAVGQGPPAALPDPAGGPLSPAAASGSSGETATELTTEPPTETATEASTGSTPETAIASLRRALAEADPDQLIRDLRSDDASATLTLELEDRFAVIGGPERRRLALAWQARAAELAYERLELRDRRGQLLGRPARVGGGMVLLQPAA